MPVSTYTRRYTIADKKIFEAGRDIADAITIAARDSSTKLLPTSNKAKEMFDAITAWRPKNNKSEESQLGFGRLAERQVARSVGSVLSYAVIDQLDQAEINAENAQKVLTFIDETGQTSALPALIVFSWCKC